jgi:hypothetical protein
VARTFFLPLPLLDFSFIFGSAFFGAMAGD